MKPEDFEALDNFVKRVRTILLHGHELPTMLKVGANEYKALYRYQKKYGIPYYGFDYNNVQVSLEEELSEDIKRIEEDTKYINKIFDGLLDISVQRDIEKWPKDFRPAIQISQTERDYLDTTFMKGTSKLYGMDLYVDECEVERVLVPEDIGARIKCSTIGPIPRKKQSA